MLNSVFVNSSLPVVEWPAPSSPDELGSNLSPDSLLAYCQSRLDSIDGQVSTLFREQQQNASATQQIDGFISELKNYESSGDVKDAATCKKLESDFQSLIVSLKNSDPACPELPTLIKTYNTMVWSGDGGAEHVGSSDPTGPDFIDRGQYPEDQLGPKGDNILSSQELQGYAQTLSDAAGNLNSDAELGMVHIQSLMSERQTAVTLTTNLVQSLGDQTNKIAENIGH
jgi:hypothetical protein